MASKHKPSDADTWDPAAVPPPGPSLADEEARQFHATHFTADPRGAAMSGAPPEGADDGPRKQRGGAAPNDSPRAGRREPRAKRRGGTGPT